MRALGIDCGSEVTGYGVVEQTPNGTLICIAAGCIRLAARKTLPERLGEVFAKLSNVIAEHMPEVVAIEDVFYAENAKSALKLGHVRGAAMLAAAQMKVPVAEYAPL